VLPRVHVGRRDVIVIPKEVQERPGIEEGMILELRVEEDKIILRAHDLWSEPRERGRKLKVNVDEAEREVNKDEELGLKRVG
jgi:AbrB family looped-hinge helix DNA binding protein